MKVKFFIAIFYEQKSIFVENLFTLNFWKEKINFILKIYVWIYFPTFPDVWIYTLSWDIYQSQDFILNNF